MAPYNSDAPVLDTYQAVVSAYSDFLTVAIHTILYERNIYPQTTFLKARKYNYPVRQSRHPKVCKWIQDAVAAVEAEMLKVISSNFYSWRISRSTDLIVLFGFCCHDASQVLPSISITKSSFMKTNAMIIISCLCS